MKRLKRYLDKYYVHNSYKKKRPDIILHTRETNKNNLLIVEIKRDGDSIKMEDDIVKIRSYWFKYPLRYRFGAAININSDKTYEIEILKR